MLFTDLLPALLGQHPTGVPMPLGGPMLQPIAKSPSNATVTPTLGAHNVPPALDPASLMNAMTNAQLKDLESQKLAWQIQQMKDYNTNDVPAIGALYGLGGGGMGVGTTMPGTNGAFGGELPPAPSRTGAAAGWGPLADPAVSAMKGAGASDAFIQAAMGHGLAEGGFQQEWAKAGGGENSFGHWQFNKEGELPGFEKFAAATAPVIGIDNPRDTRLQALYVMQRAEQLHPGITNTDDPNQAMDVLGTKFERYKGNAPGQRRDYLAAAQRALAVPDVPTADMGGAGTRYGAAFGGSTTPLSDTMATAINPIPIPTAPQMAAAPQMAGGAATPTTVTPLGGSAQPAVPTQAPPAFGSLAPGGMPNVPPPGANPQMVAAMNMLRKGMAMSAAGLPVGNLMVQIVQNSPAFKAQQAYAEALAGGYGKLPTAEALAAAAERGAAPYKWNTLRPGSVGGYGGNMTVAAPLRADTYDAEGNAHPGFITPPLPGAAGAAGGGAVLPPAPVPGTGAAQLADAGNAPITKIGPYTEESLKKRGVEEQTNRQLVIDQGTNALLTDANIRNMQSVSPDFLRGAGAEGYQTLSRILRVVDPSYNKQVSSFEQYNKDLGQLTRTAVRETSARAAVQEFKLIGDTLPTPTTSPQGMDRVLNEYRGLNNFRQAKMQAQAQWEQDHGGTGHVANFETDFAKKVSPYSFIVARMAPEDRADVYKKLNTSEEGRRELKLLATQLQYIHTNRMEPY